MYNAYEKLSHLVSNNHLTLEDDVTLFVHEMFEYLHSKQGKQTIGHLDLIN